MRVIYIIYFMYLAGIIYARSRKEAASHYPQKAGCILVFLSDVCFNLTDMIKDFAGARPAFFTSKAEVKIFAPETENVIYLPLVNFTFT